LSGGRYLSLPVLLVRHMLHPIHVLAVELFCDRDVGHGAGRRRAVPVLFARGKPDHVADVNLFDGTADSLNPTRSLP
jgi:hypothetical protein